jgi:hypothetical protein
MGSVKKRSQVSLFFIIGVCLLIILIIILYIRSRTYTYDDKVTLPEKILPAKKYMEFCMDDASKNAFYLVGSQAGFVDIPIETKFDPSRRISLGGGSEMIPYWYYEGKNWIPRLDFIEKELAAFIAKDFQSCINNMDFSQYGYVVRKLKDNATVTVKINDKDISVELEYPVEISAEEYKISSRISKFYKKYDVRLKDMMELAEYIVHYENRNFFLENITIGLMSINPEIPFSGMRTECGQSKWYINDIRYEIQDMITSTFFNIRVEGTDYFPFKGSEETYAEYADYAEKLNEAYGEVSLTDNFEQPEDYENALNAEASKVKAPKEPLPEDSYFYFHMFMPMEEKDKESKRFENFSVDFLYSPMYGMDILGKPSSNGVLKSNTVNGMMKYLSFFCLNIYHFTYDITYPVLITLHDPDALNTEGYTFRFALPVLIRNNEGIRSSQFIEIVPERPDFENYCEESIGNSAIIKVYDKSKEGTVLIEDVNISMLCANKKCPLGRTQKHTFGTYLKANITSSCGNPYILAEKENYFRAWKLLDDIKEDPIEIDMVPLKNFSLDFKKHTISSSDNTISQAQEVNSGSVSVYISGFFGTMPYENMYIFKAEEENMIQLPLDDSDYDLSVNYMKNNEDFSGGYYNIWNVSADALGKGNSITFHFVEIVPSSLDEEAAESMALIENMTSSPLLLPEVK